MSSISKSATYLVAILLVAQTSAKSEPRLIFHYPPKPGEDDARLRHLLKEPTDDDTSSSENEDDASDELSPIEEPEPSPKSNPSPPDFEEVGSASPDTRNSLLNDVKNDKWNTIFDRDPHSLAKMLAPSQMYHKRRLEIGINGKVFLGKPYYAKEDGSWRKLRKRRSSSKSTNQLSMLDSVVEEGRMQPPDESLTDIKEEPLPIESSSENHEELDTTEDVLDHTRGDTNKLEQPVSTASATPASSLKMFSLIFVLDPPPLDYHQRVNEMYAHVAKKLSRALRWEQARSDYISHEVSSIVNVTKKFKMTSVERSRNLNPLYHDLWSTSSLVKQLCTLYNTLTTTRTAHIKINTLSLSLQLPTPSSIESLPSSVASNSETAGAWLSTAPSMILDHHESHNSSTHNSNNSNGTSNLSAHFGLLLLEDYQTILSDLQRSSDPRPSPFLKSMLLYLQTSKSTKSFLQVSKLSGLSLQDIHILASHLIFWKKARAVPPLNQRDIYIFSPNADLSSLTSATSTFAKTFPLFPPLPRFLSLLSRQAEGGPKPFSALIKSKDLKEDYMNILAWLMRGGWVTQLRSFAWIRIPPHIIESAPAAPSAAAAEHDRTARENDRAADKLHRPNHSQVHEPTPTGTNPPSHSSSLSSAATMILSPRPPSTQPPPAHLQSPAPLSTSPSSRSSPIIISNPSNPTTPSQSRYLSALSRWLHSTQGQENGDAWDTCVHYFDGKHAIESIPVVEGWKKRRVQELVSGWEGLGVLVRVRHW